MNEDEGQRMRDAIQHDQTLCRCGHLLAACADCRGWLVENSWRIQMDFMAWWRCVKAYSDILTPGFRVRIAEGNIAEADDLAYYLGGR